CARYEDSTAGVYHFDSW
nr:immunoglobulin heavy chain junction region [Macaca mulatta]MOW75129.1 immunoglobulin heavy chain junction region [Macaca mulatta]MOW75189.1 immunoglobulin heavy chain junction region [Macaca mulatta]MOW75288.1 immunoglobulin heavy chain junction region [Macaca mulatta]MOW75442.1 immunoglobulin heavy chain junction region [Macaca mulatta]